MDQPVFKNVKCLNFQCYSSEEIKRLSALEITNLEILDTLGNAAPNGLYDLRMGPNDRDDVCGTCFLGTFTCPGHPGHIALPAPVYNPVFFLDLYKLLRGSCFSCHHLIAPPVAQQLVLFQLKALDYGLVSTVQDLAEVVTDPSAEADSTESFLHIVRSKLEAKFEEAVKDAKTEERPCPVKSVVECRRSILKNFTKNHMMKAAAKCPHCRQSVRKLTKYNLRLVYKDVRSVGSDSLTSEIGNKELTPDEAMRHLQMLWENDKTLMQNLYKTMYRKEPTDTAPVHMFFMNLLLVPPSRFRRMNFLHGRKYADAQTILYSDVMKDCNNLKMMMRKIAKMDISDADKSLIQKIPGKTDGDKYSNLYQQLQRHITEIYDSDINKDKNKISKGIKQILEKKEGMFRMNMMGKRVNSAARSVISPDPYIMVNEIGIPMVFAKKLTFPEPVNYANFQNLYKAVMNGPDVHPGASWVEMEDGRRVKLTTEDHVNRQAIAKTLLTPQTSSTSELGRVKIVHRHLKNGDMLLLNRQPTLHKPSIMAHKARVLPGEKTLRLHYSNCKSYNADFDGDEMNCHFPQSYQGQAEARHIVGVNHQYLVPKDGTPLGGLIQDHIIAAVLLTMRGRFFTKEDYQKLIYSAMAFHTKRLILLPPTILKPEMLWSGKQIVSTLIINLIPEGKQPPTLEGKAKVSSKNWKNAPTREWLAGGTPLVGDSMTESEVIIRHGELLCGVIDKAQIGPTPYSLIHVCFELYGGECSSTILTALARLFTHHLQYFAGFSLGIEDIVVNTKPNKKRKRILQRASAEGRSATAKAIDVDNPENPDEEELLTKYRQVHFNRDDIGLKMLDMEMKKVTHSLNNDINQVCIPSGLRKKFPQNNLQLMVESGAKGSTVNAMQISCLLGQIELEGRRMPLMRSGSTLPSFLPYDTSPGAGGFVGGRFLTGINPQEYFFHCMAGREGLIDTAVKTSRSGYLQRCLIKHLEGIKVDYDLTVRDSDGTVIQFLYGEDGMDPLKVQMLKKNRLHLLGANYKAAISRSHVKMLKDMREDDIEKEKKKISRWKKKHSGGNQKRESLIPEVDYKPVTSTDIRERVRQITSYTSYLEESYKKNYYRSMTKCPDPVNSKHRPDLSFASVCEKLDSIISDYISENPHGMILEDGARKKKNRLTTENFKDLCYFRSMRSLAEPGETVGLLAAQSIGEPSTQMTLNTFHFAGKGEMNVTLGIPRIREILMTASPNIATPTMDLPLLPNIKNRLQQAEKLKLKLSPASLKDVLDGVKIVERRSVPKAEFFIHGESRTRVYTIRMSFLKHSEYKEHKNTTPSKILDYVEKHFIKRLIEALKKKMKISSTSKLVDILKESSTGMFRSEQSGAGGDEDDPAPAPTNKTSKEGDGGESSEESEGEGDTTSAKSKNRHNQDQEYEDPEDEEMIPESDAEESDSEKAEMSVNVKEEPMSEGEAEEGSSASPEDKKRYKKREVPSDKVDERVRYVLTIHNWVTGYSFDTVAERWCEIELKIDLNTISVDMKSLLEEEIAKANIHSVRDIKEAILVKNEDAKNGAPDLMIKTDGVNFLEIFGHVDILDINKVYSNNIQEIAKIYGIEAAAKAIRKETVGVFAAYGIEVDPRHLSLISDYMTCSGFYRPCNRLGMEGNASPLQQMTFETSKNFMVDAMFMGTGDTLKSPSANIIVGQMYRGGTGSFDIFNRCGEKE
ncbi:hypothetical protein JTE90_020098 [Oedothorax gibbosus]|uniref:DNA-directed RNA polymerase subunit n=1 Tax=Oedothorax gibbosus TaxID=931172 RepID=A0AAV6VM85_9ARAC|nr:hypothetical protein JTE90_020098 [Oedothorax gibbosus]